MAKIRVFLLTYRRAHLLPRALASLRAQTFPDWVCEVHNDAPDDPEPERIVRAAGDPRLVYVPHAANWGAVRSFNHVYRGGPEPLASLLEDDNWWEPAFLAPAIAALESDPEASLAWANMRLWQEEADGTWTDTGRTIWPAAPPGSPPVPFRGPELIQCSTALASNGAMVFRPGRFRDPQLPPNIPFAIAECARERTASGTLLLLPEPLAHFSHTRQSVRGDDRLVWLQCQLLAAASFFSVLPVAAADLERLWQMERTRRPQGTFFLFLTAVALRSGRLLKPARSADWFRFLAGVARHPRLARRGLRFRRDQAEAWAWLVKQTRAAHAARSAVHATVFEKSEFTYSEPRRL